jgi:LemA protein
MKKSYIIIAAIGGLILIVFLMYYNAYSGAVSKQENLDEKWNNVQSAYQRRADLIPNLIKTVKGAAKNEKDILLQVTQARAGIVDAKTPEDLEIMGKKINTAINIMYEAYPQIKSTENFRDLQTQLEGTENRIKTSRDEYNQATKEYNTHIRGFFNSMFINHETFPRKTGFKADKGADKVPEADL